MTKVTFILPILAGKEEVWRRVLQELGGSRSRDLERASRRYGIHAVRVWLQRTRHGAVAVILMELDDPVQAVSMLAGSEEDFDRWLKHGIRQYHGVDVGRARPKMVPELVFRSAPDPQIPARPANGERREGRRWS